jgi:hypothetical protein
VSDRLVCPYCGKPFEAHAGQMCPVLDAAMTKTLRDAVAFVMNDRDERVKRLATSSAITPRRYPLDNSTPAGKANNAQQILGFNLNRGIAIAYNDDAADVMLAEDAQHAHDATKQFVLKAKSAIAFSSPNELWAVGTTAGPQNVYVLELPPGRAAAEAIALVMQSVGTGTTPSVTRLQDGTTAALATLLVDNADGVAASATANDLAVVARLTALGAAGVWDRLKTALNIDAGLTAGVLAVHDAKVAIAAAATVATQVLSTLQTAVVASARQVSAANAANVLIIDLRNLATSLSIHMAASGGTATLTVEGSVDGVNWIQADSIAAAQFTVKVYGSTTAGAAAAAAGAGPIAPLSFRQVRITAGAAGVGNTTTLTVSAK